MSFLETINKAKEGFSISYHDFLLNHKQPNAIHTFVTGINAQAIKEDNLKFGDLKFIFHKSFESTNDDFILDRINHLTPNNQKIFFLVENTPEVLAYRKNKIIFINRSKPLNFVERDQSVLFEVMLTDELISDDSWAILNEYRLKLLKKELDESLSEEEQIKLNFLQKLTANRTHKKFPLPFDFLEKLEQTVQYENT